MKLSSKTHYGIMACHVLGRNYPDTLVSASVIEAQTGVSAKYMEKIMRMLASRGIINASRGKSGGYSLSRSPSDITIGEVVRALEDDMEIIECVKDGGKCKCCPTSKVWKKLYEGINELLDSMTLEQMIKGEI